MPQKPATPSPTYLRALLATAFLTVVVAGAILAGYGDNGEPYTANGRVRCASGTAPVGIWLAATLGDAGWAPRKPEPGTSAVRFARAVPHGGRYSLHVGCGGTREDWGMTAISDTYRSETIDIVCNDIPSRFGAIARWVPPVLWPGDTPQYARCESA